MSDSAGPVDADKRSTLRHCASQVNFTGWKSWQRTKTQPAVNLRKKRLLYRFFGLAAACPEGLAAYLMRTDRPYALLPQFDLTDDGRVLDLRILRQHQGFAEDDRQRAVPLEREENRIATRGRLFRHNTEILVAGLH